MRRHADAQRIETFANELGRSARSEVKMYLTGGATAVLVGWRDTTVDIDVRLEPESDELLRAIPALKERLEVNVELASPLDFIPELPGWRDRSPFVVREGQLDVRHFDFYGQVLAKIERGFAQDMDDVAAMLVAMAAPRLRSVGLHVPDHAVERPSHRLYDLLAAEHADSAHGRYNAHVGRMVSFARAAEHAQAR